MKLPNFLNPNAIKLGTYGPPLFKQSLLLSPDEIRTMIHVQGITGSGKSRFLAALFLSLCNRGLGATLIDPHGDLARLVLGHLVVSGAFTKPGAYKRIRYLDVAGAARRQLYLPFNVLDQDGPPHTRASNVLEAMHRAWPSLAGGSAPMFDTLVLNGVKVLISNGLPLPALYRFLIEKDFRDQLLAHESDQDIVSVFRDWYDRLPLRDQLDQSGSALRRVGLLIFDPVLKYSLAQRAMSVKAREDMDANRDTILNIALDNTETRRVLGCLLNVGAEQAALSRAELPPEARLNSHHLILDEFSEFSAQSEEALSRMLSLVRKYGLFVVMAHQTWSQTSERLRGALQNVGLEVVFRLGRADAEYSATILGRVDPLLVKHEVEDATSLGKTHPVFYSLNEQWNSWTQAIQDLPQREAFIKQANGQVAHVRTIPVPDPKCDAAKLREVEDYYLQTYFRPQADIDQELASYRTAGEPTPPKRANRMYAIDEEP
jgi:hypothetical protein